MIAGARQVHTLGLGYPIDVVFCDTEWRVLHVVSPLAPQRVTKWVRNARWAIEMRTGAAATIARGDDLVVE